MTGRPTARERALVVRLDSDGDVLLAGPAVRAVARTARVTMLVSPAGAQAAALLPGVGAVVVWECPWTGYHPPPVDRAATTALVDRLRRSRFDTAVVLTSHHQSPLPTALLLRLAGIRRIAAISADYPGSLLDLRCPEPGGHEVQRALALVAAAGFPAPDRPARQALAVRRPLPAPPPGLPRRPFVVVHPGASVPARAPDPDHARAIVAALVGAGWPVVVTGSPAERALTARVAHGLARDLGGHTDWPELASVLASAACTVSGNTGPAHLSAAVGTPVVSLFAPVVPAQSWAPWGVPHRLLGDQDADCALTRARECPEPGHPCLSGIAPQEVVDAVAELTADRAAARAAAQSVQRRAARGAHQRAEQRAGRRRAGQEAGQPAEQGVPA